MKKFEFLVKTYSTLLKSYDEGFVTVSHPDGLEAAREVAANSLGVEVKEVHLFLRTVKVLPRSSNARARLYKSFQFHPLISSSQEE